MLTGWQKQSGKWYYLDENDNYGVMCIGEVNIDEKTYYFNGNILIKMDLCKSDGSL